MAEVNELLMRIKMSNSVNKWEFEYLTKDL